ncbi:MAG: tetratricopeptide repeat protein [Caldilineaceae bacterium]
MTNQNLSADELQRIINDSAKLLHQNRPGEAAALLEPLYKVAPTHPDLAINLGGAYILQRKWDRAVKVLAKAAEASPENAMLWTNLGAAHLGNLKTAGPKQQERAIRAYEKALQADPESPNVHYHLGLIYKERGELMRASAFFQRALEVRPSDRDARYWLDLLGALLAEQQNRRDLDASTGADA